MEANISELTPLLLDKLRNMNHEVGFIDPDGGEEYEANYLSFEKDGWEVDLTYSLCGKWVSDKGDYLTPPDTYLSGVWCRVDELIITYSDSETGEEFEFSDKELSELKDLIIETVTESVSLY